MAVRFHALDRLLAEDKGREVRKQALAILTAGLEAADPTAAIRSQVHREEGTLQVGPWRYNLNQHQQVMVTGGGKASGAMALAMEGILGPFLSKGFVNVKYGYSAKTEKIKIQEAGHPVPDQAGIDGTQRIVNLLRTAGAEDLVIFLISGGGSALMVLPSQGITLDDMQTLTNALLRCGATINEINAVRKHLSQIKGGQLARLAHPAELLSLILSDVVGDPLEVIASGPTAPDPTTFAQAYEVLAHYQLLNDIPSSILQHLERGCRGEIADTPKEGDPVFSRVHNLIVGSNESAATAAVEKAQELGFNTCLLSTFVEGEAREVGKVLVGIAKEIVHRGQPVPRPACIVAGGETTVTVGGDGLGGRNQELALSAALALEGIDDVLIVSSATDGSDGPTDACGAMADGQTVARARRLGLDARRYLANNDSYHFFQALGDLIVTGPTNTNVNDLMFIVAK